MWRFWNCIPRFVRQQCHGPRASAGVYVEEEKAEHEVEKFVNESTQQDHDGRPFCVRSQRDSEQGPEEAGRSDGTNQDHSHRWRSHCYGDFWSKFCSQHRSLEAATWGAAVVLGLHLSRQRHFENFFEELKDPDKRQRWRGLLFRVAFTMPPDAKLSVAHKVIKGDAKLQHDVEPGPVQNKKKGKNHASAAKTSEVKKTLDDVILDFESSCRQYAAVGSTVSGISAADQGHSTEAVEHLWQACQLGHAPAYFNLAVCYDLGLGMRRDEKKAALYYRMAADVGHTQSIFNLALMTLRGDGGMVKDRDKAILLLNKAAQQGLAEAQTFLGVYYTEDDDHQQDFEQAAFFFKAAADQNDAEGLYFLGICYENGWGVESSDVEAARLYTAAAQLDHDGAKYNLAAFYEYGLGGLSCDEEEAMELYRQAAQLGNENAKSRLKEAEAKQAISQWAEQSTISSSKGQVSAVRLSSHSSSPSLTDRMHEDLAGMWVGELAARSSLQSLVTSQQQAKNQSVIFTTEGHAIPLDSRAAEEDSVGSGVSYSFLDLSGDDDVAPSYVAGMHRTSTMPELRMVSCQ